MAVCIVFSAQQKRVTLLSQLEGVIYVNVRLYVCVCVHVCTIC